MYMATEFHETIYEKIFNNLVLANLMDYMTNITDSYEIEHAYINNDIYVGCEQKAIDNVIKHWYENKNKICEYFDEHYGRHPGYLTNDDILDYYPNLLKYLSTTKALEPYVEFEHMIASLLSAQGTLFDSLKDVSAITDIDELKTFLIDECQHFKFTNQELEEVEQFIDKQYLEILEDTSEEDFDISSLIDYFTAEGLIENNFGDIDCSLINEQPKEAKKMFHKKNIMNKILNSINEIECNIEDR